MEKYLMDFFDEVVAGKYGKTTITKLHVAQFVEKAAPQDVEQVDELYWEWTSILAEPEDIDMGELTKIVFAVMRK